MKFLCVIIHLFKKCLLCIYSVVEMKAPGKTQKWWKAKTTQTNGRRQYNKVMLYSRCGQNAGEYRGKTSTESVLLNLGLDRRWDVRGRTLQLEGTICAKVPRHPTLRELFRNVMWSEFCGVHGQVMEIGLGLLRLHTSNIISLFLIKKS